ncbi:MAG: NifU-like protein [bacterium ADurb.Bin400]|nr:MAG: NifU-like protein [bacterium ADurb.Bin400]
MDSIYQEVILHHYKYPKNFGHIHKPTHASHKNNPLCGDDISIEIGAENGTVVRVGFTGSGCALATASASILMEHIKGMRLNDVASLTSENLLALIGVSPSPSRLKCALLPLEVLHSTLSHPLTQ